MAGNTLTGYDKRKATTFADLANARLDELADTVEVHGPDGGVKRVVQRMANKTLAFRIGQALGEQYDATQVRRVLAGEAGAYHLSPEMVEAWAEALGMDRAAAFHAAGVLPPDLSLDAFRKAFKGERVKAPSLQHGEGSSRKRTSDQASKGNAQYHPRAAQMGCLAGIGRSERSPRSGQPARIIDLTEAS
jgi:hypothetical protein